ncbi:N-acetyl-D-Glu racemase DgcA [Tianweitania sediminis]|uniref:Dipeptide epimerase n=1 Tax=Tianweitania sediminis TaxID=1502156 RepID=A0A8J7UKD1_9HYPH|nr:N-acetyl-D-Glu racemase DgcA [Tianweitania sediminis]MBP0439755.1 dipeptide epimerase [Tianweitania sediminis]
MRRELSVATELFPIAGTFTIARGSKTEAEVVVCRLSEGSAVGWGECVPYRRYGETVASVRAEIEAARTAIEEGAGREALLALMPAGAARNALDCALWDLECKLAGKRASELAGLGELAPIETAFTLSLATADAMAAAARENAWRPLLKVKVGTPDDVERMRAVAQAAPRSRIILDANEGWTAATLEPNLAEAARLGIAMIEQPLPAGDDLLLSQIARPVPVCADESAHGVDDLAMLRDRYDVINIKLDKTGGLTAALRLRRDAEAAGLGIMVGCMVGTSLGMAPATLVAQGAAFVDLDGPLLLARDRDPALRYDGSMLYPPKADLWG